MERRQRESVRSRKDDDMDRISDLPDSILLHIMEFMDIRSAVQTCILSTRWKDLWKSLTNLTLHFAFNIFARLSIFNNFVSRILSCRDGSIPVHNLYFMHAGCTKTTFLNRLMKYAASHNVQRLKIEVKLNLKHDLELPPSIFSCKSLTYLDLSILPYDGHILRGRSLTLSPDMIRDVKLPKSLELPALQSLHLEYVTFSTSDNGYAEPFSTCYMLNTLVINCCYLRNDAKGLCISNSNLSSLTIDCDWGDQPYKIALSTPNLSSLSMGRIMHELSSASNLPFLEEVDLSFIHLVDFPNNSLVLSSWLQVLANVKTMTLWSSTLRIVDGISKLGSMITQPPCFVRLKSLKVLMDGFAKISHEGVSRIVGYLLQNSPLAKVDIIICIKRYHA